MRVVVATGQRRTSGAGTAAHDVGLGFSGNPTTVDGGAPAVGTAVSGGAPASKANQWSSKV
jgi:hypothetical protein